MREDLIERRKFLDVLNYFMRKHPEMPLTEIERKNHLSQGLLIKTAYNNRSNYMRVETFDKYCEMLEKCEEEQNDRDRFNSQKYKWTTLECYGCFRDCKKCVLSDLWKDKRKWKILGKNGQWSRIHF